jgi:hypothetical protein
MKSYLTRVLLLSLIFFIWLPDSFSQSPKPRKYTTIITSTVRTKTKGMLLEGGDSSVLIYLRGLQMRTHVEKFVIKGDQNMYKNHLDKFRKYVRASPVIP